MIDANDLRAINLIADDFKKKSTLNWRVYVRQRLTTLVPGASQISGNIGFIAMEGRSFDNFGFVSMLYSLEVQCNFDQNWSIKMRFFFKRSHLGWALVKEKLINQWLNLWVMTKLYVFYDFQLLAIIPLLFKNDRVGNFETLEQIERGKEKSWGLYCDISSKCTGPP